MRVVVRDASRLEEAIRLHPRLSVVEAGISEMSEGDIRDAVQGCSAAASCLGHTPTLLGLFGPPYRLVTDATRRICQALGAQSSGEPCRFVLMSSTGVRDPGLDEPVSLAERMVIFLLRLLLPPHADNEEAALFLRRGVGSSDAKLEWAMVRPDRLVDQARVSDYEAYPSPIRSAIFDSGPTSRVNVAHFMASLMTERELWKRWVGTSPVLYDAGEPADGASPSGTA